VPYAAWPSPAAYGQSVLDQSETRLVSCLGPVANSAAAP
jgi:hypothetical protein